MRVSPQQIAGYAIGAGFPPDQIATAVAVALAESGGETTATNRNSNGSTDYGLWQINTVHGALLNQGDKFNGADNAKMALTVYARAGNKWTPWSVYKSGTYRAQMGTGTLAAAKPIAPDNGPATAPDPNATTAGINATPAASPFDILGPIGAALGSLTSVVNKLTSGGLWLRIGSFMVGSLLIGLSLLRLSGAEKVVVPAVKTAAKAAAAVAL
jgi:hypothetical protein